MSKKSGKSGRCYTWNSTCFAESFRADTLEALNHLSRKTRELAEREGLRDGEMVKAIKIGVVFLLSAYIALIDDVCKDSMQVIIYKIRGAKSAKNRLERT